MAVEDLAVQVEQPRDVGALGPGHPALRADPPGTARGQEAVDERDLRSVVPSACRSGW